MSLAIRRTGECALAALISLLAAHPAATADYYFSDSGNDQTGDGTEVNPWRSVAKFNSLDLSPGDRAYFRAGETFHGSLFLDENDSGVDQSGNLVAPIVIGSYGSPVNERAIIRSSSNSAAVLSRNNGGIELRDLEFVNGGSFSSNSAPGIQFELDENLITSGSHLQHLRVDNVTSHGFHRSGFSIYSAVNSGYKDVQITNSQFYDNQFAGIEIGAAEWTELIHQQIEIDSVQAHNNLGFEGCAPHCGHGIVIGQVNGAVIENSVAHSNGLTAGRGNVGIWTWQSNDVVIQRNLAYGNRSPNGGDGGGFDLDGGVTNSVVQQNISQDNAGAGYLLAQFAFAEPMEQNTFRYNLSVNDGIDEYGAITIWGEDSSSIADSALFHNNTVVVDKDLAPNSRGPVSFLNENHSNIDFINNVFVALNGAELIEGPVSLAKSQFINNAYWTDGSPVSIGDSDFDSISAWAALTQQETLNGEFAGMEADPLFAPDGSFRPTGTSPLIDAGLPADQSAWPTWWLGLPAMDLYGVVVPQGSSVDIGAAESELLSGDYTHDGVVDAADYVAWRKLAQPTELYATWKTNFGESLDLGSGGMNSSAEVPEPQALINVITVVSLLLVMRYGQCNMLVVSRPQPANNV